MIGGIVVQVVEGLWIDEDPESRSNLSGCRVEVLDITCFDRQWRHLPQATGVHEGDSLWWQSHRGYLSTEEDGFEDLDVGPCLPCENPLVREAAG
jgi:hypothetical protein